MRLALCALLPLIGSALLVFLRFPTKRARNVYVECVTVLTSVAVGLALCFPGEGTFELFRVSDMFVCAFKTDGLGTVFIALAALLWPFASLYAFEYMEHEHREGQFFTFYTMAYGVTILLAASANLFTLYIFYELLTLITLPLVSHIHDKESYRAGRSYLTYLIGGASLGFAAMILFHFYGSGVFAAGGSLGEAARWHPNLMQVAFLMGFFGFGAKAAIFPLCNWLPRASVAPTPVTALLHAVAVVNAGVFAVARVAYYVCGAEFLLGTTAQSIVLIFSGFTVAYGAIRAAREGHVKRRLAWSTVSNLSYMLFALSLFTRDGFTAGMTHMVFHGIMKIVLFFCAGALLTTSHITRVTETRGLAKKMPVTFAAYLVAGLALAGVPPMSGFVSKYLIITAAFKAGGTIQMIGACSLIVSAILTAVYIFTVVVPAYFMPANSAIAEKAHDPGLNMKVVLITLSVIIVIVSLLSGQLVDALSRVAGGY